VRGLLFKCKKGLWQALTGAGLPFGLLGFGLVSYTSNYVFKETSSEKKNSQDSLLA
jgi:hypothetical protein